VTLEPRGGGEGGWGVLKWMGCELDERFVKARKEKEKKRSLAELADNEGARINSYTTKHERVEYTTKKEYHRGC